MHLRVGVTAAVVACAVAVSCGPTIPPCTAESCAGGCCDAAGVCVAGRSVFACGTGGAACAVCGDGQQCTGAVCVAVPEDAGVDAGLDAGVDAGDADAGVDAGPLRTVTINRLFEALTPDGGVTMTAADLSGVSMSLFYEVGRGGWVTVSGLNFGTEVRFEAVPQGPFAVVTRSATGALIANFVSDQDAVNIGPKVLGRRSAAYSPTNIAFDAGLGLPWQAGDTITATSFGAGMAKDSFTLSRSTDASVVATGDLSSSSQPFVVAAGDDLALTLNRQYNDGGFVQAALLGVVMPSPDLPSGRTTVFETPVLVELPRDQATVSLGASDYAQFALDVNPAASPASNRLLVSVTPHTSAPDGGGDFDGRSAILLSVSKSGTVDIEGTFSWGQPFEASAATLFRALSTFTVPLTYQGRTLNRNIDALTTTRLGAGTVALGPELSPPRYVRINGETAFVNRNGVSTTPVLEWAPPALGRPTHYTVNLWKVTLSGNNLVQSFVSSVVSPWPRLRVPPGLLQPGEAYFAFINAQRTSADVRRTPYRTSREADEAVAMTNVFTP